MADDKEDPFDKEQVKNEIEYIINEINKLPINKELTENKNITTFKLISINAGMIIKLSKLVGNMSDNVHLHSNILIKFTNAMKFIKKYLTIALFLAGGSMLLSMLTLIYVLTSG